MISVNSYAIAILSYNHPEITQKCINSVLKLNFSGEIYLIHNGSTQKHIDLLMNIYPTLTHRILPENAGYAVGANFTLSEVFKTYSDVLFLTNDTELIQLPPSKPNLFSSVKSYKRKTDQIDSVGGLIDIKYGRLFHKKNLEPSTNSIDLMTYIPGTAFWINKYFFEALGGFDESFHTYWEDVDFSYRAHLNKYPLGHCNQTVIRHKIGKTCHKHDFYTFYLYQRNRKKFMQKHKLTNLYFWLSFYKNIIKNCKFRFLTTWNILND
jgi:GT2 family glycosyltransferase